MKTKQFHGIDFKGCFSLFRGKALMDDNVAKMYTTVSTEPRHFIQVSTLLSAPLSGSVSYCLAVKFTRSFGKSSLFNKFTGYDRPLAKFNAPFYTAKI